MRIRGINYDTGFLIEGTTTHEPFDPARVKREMKIIHDDLHCNAVRVTGGHVARLEIASGYAADAGLEVWLCPFTNNLTADEVLALIADCADAAERLRLRGANIILLTGSELSLFTLGFLPGDTLTERLGALSNPLRLREIIPEIRAQMRELLSKAIGLTRARFSGRISYASLPFEAVDWSSFDIISTDAGYRTAAMAARFRDDIRAFVAQGRAQGKPVAITEFGCAAHRGGADVTDRADSMIEWGAGARPVRLTGDYVRDEEEQSRYLRELLDVFSTEGVDAAFVYTFARYDLPHRVAAHEDFDLASRGIVRVLEGRSGLRYPGMPWEPKAAFDALADYYRNLDL